MRILDFLNEKAVSADLNDLFLGMDKSDSWHVYIIECKDKKLYVGVAKDLDKRIKLHKKGLVCRFTKYRKPVKLIYKERHCNKSEARNK